MPATCQLPATCVSCHHPCMLAKRCFRSLVCIAAGAPDEEFAARIDATFTIGHDRTMVQDAGFGVRQIVDVALKALSPGINDTTTAVTCVNYLSAILARLAARRSEARYRMDAAEHGAELRVIARGPTFQGMLAEAFDQIRQNAQGNVAVLLALLTALEAIGDCTHDAQRRAALRAQADLIGDAARFSIPDPRDRHAAEAIVKRLQRDPAEARTPG